MGLLKEAVTLPIDLTNYFLTVHFFFLSFKIINKK